MSDAVAVGVAESELALRAVFGAPDENGAFGGAMVKEKSRRVKYWRKPDGWIERGPDASTDPPKWQQFSQGKRYKELPNEFGREVAGVAGGIMAPHRPAPRGRETRWLEPFIKNGGLTYQIRDNDSFGFGPSDVGNYLFPKEQIVTYGMHRNPDIKALRPDLEDVVDLECPYGCIDADSKARRLFAGVTHEDAQRSVDQHIVAVHSNAVASRAVGDTIAEAMKNHQGSTIDAATIAQIVAATVTALTQTQQAAVSNVVTTSTPEPQVFSGHVNVPTSNDTPVELSRNDIMSLWKEHGWAWPENGTSLNTEQWRALYRGQEELASV